MINKCKSYHLQPTTRYTYHPLTGRPIAHDIEVGVCWGTKECDQCDCGGDMVQCDFYPEVRKKALKKRKPKFGEWISVEDGLPERIGKYLVYTYDRRIYIGNFIDYYCDGDPQFDDYKVTHWMPLPSPPTENND